MKPFIIKKVAMMMTTMGVRQEEKEEDFSFFGWETSKSFFSTTAIAASATSKEMRLVHFLTKQQ
jgi:hypothetical protein